jgi:hypothetical protein
MHQNILMFFGQFMIILPFQSKYQSVKDLGI